MTVYMFCSAHGIFDAERPVEDCEECHDKVSSRFARGTTVVSSTPTGEFRFKRGSTPKIKGVGDGRSSAEFERDHDAWDKARYREIQDQRKKKGFRPIGSVSAEEYIALKRETGDPHVWRNPTDALKRLGKYVKP